MAISTADLIGDTLAAVPLPGLVVDQSERIIAANTGAQRTGTLTVAGQTVTITQSAPRPRIFLTTFQGLASFADTVSVAPNSFAISSFSSTRSTP